MMLVTRAIRFLQILPDYYTPPYLTAEPEVSHRELTEDDKFVVIATDGLWEHLSNEQIINIVGDNCISLINKIVTI